MARMDLMPEILLQPTIPKPLHGVAPRKILGSKWWDEERQKAYASTNYHCAACGVHKLKAKYHQWLEAHEYYDYTYNREDRSGFLTYNESIPLCHSCHSYIHKGLLCVLLGEKKISLNKYQDILEHGDSLIEKVPRPNTEVCEVDWKKWRMIVQGKAYGPSSSSFEAWKRGEWKNWKP